MRASYAGAYDAPMGKLVVALPAEGPMTVQLGGQRPIPVAAVSQTELRTIGVALANTLNFIACLPLTWCIILLIR